MDMKMNEQGRQSMGRQNYWLGSTQRFFKAANGKTELRVEKPAELFFVLFCLFCFFLCLFFQTYSVLRKMESSIALDSVKREY